VARRLRHSDISIRPDSLDASRRRADSGIDLMLPPNFIFVTLRTGKARPT